MSGRGGWCVERKEELRKSLPAPVVDGQVELIWKCMQSDPLKVFGGSVACLGALKICFSHCYCYCY